MTSGSGQVIKAMLASVKAATEAGAADVYVHHACGGQCVTAGR